MPNKTVGRLWHERAKDFGIASKLQVETLHSVDGVHARKRLVIVDEAHARLQLANGIGHGKVAHAARGKAVLLVSATPYQLTASGLITMMSVAGEQVAGTLAVVREYASALAELAGQCERARRHLTVDELVVRPWVRHRMGVLKALRLKARAALEPYLMSRYPRREVGIPDPPPLKGTLVLLGDWELAYHVGRIVPELIETGKGGMLQRGLVSSPDQFGASAAGRALAESHPELSAELLSRLGKDHPKLTATVEWVSRRVKVGRRVAVFCHFHATQRAIAEALEAAVGPALVHAPAGDKIHPDICKRFTTSGGQGLALILTDRFSESIDLDGGRPCLVHHDLSWNPSRLEQRWGRLVRASTGFRDIDADDIFVPVLAAATDERMFDTVKARSAIRAAVLTDGLSTPDESGLEDHGSVLPRQLIEELLADSPEAAASS